MPDEGPQTPPGLFAHALIVGKFAPLHAGHQFLIETARRESRRVTVLVYSNPDFPGMPQKLRAGWVKALYPDVDVRVPENSPPDAASDEVHRIFARDFVRGRGLAVDVVFSSESYGPGFAAVLGAAHRMVDRQRTTFPVSGTAVRRDPAACSAYLPALVLRHLARGVDTGRALE